jgi:dTMP kinase
VTLRRRLIVFEGPEGAGKSTQLARVADWLRASGVEVVTLREPGGTPLGDEIRRLLLDADHDVDERAEALLFMASRAQLVATRIRPAMSEGSVVLLDRFFLSTYAYQVAGRGLAADVIRAANAAATGGLVPDLTILLSLAPETGLTRVGQRGTHDRMERADAAFHARVGAAFASYADARWQEEHPECGPIELVDADRPEGAVFSSIVETFVRHWPESFPVRS